MALLKDLIVQGASRFVGDAYFNNIKSGTFYGNLAGGAKGSIPYQSASDTTTLLGIGTAGQVLKVGSSGVPEWGSDSNSDTKVTQTVTGSGNTDYRPLIVGSSSSGSSTPTFSTVTDTAYATHQIYVKPSTGDFYTAGTLVAAGFGSKGTNGNVEGAYISHPGGGCYTTNSTIQTGYLKITLPKLDNNTMMSFDVTIFTYIGNNQSYVTYHISGYEYSSDGWYNSVTKVYSEGVGPYTNLTVRLGNDGSKACVTIGESNTSWSYPQVTVHNVMTGYGGSSVSNWNSGWSIGFTTTALTTIVSEKTTVNTQNINVLGNAATASKWATARTLTLSGAVTGSASIDGSGNVTLSTSVNHNHDSSYVLKAGDTMTGALTTPSLTVTGASSFSQAINGSILGNAATASRWQNARTLTLTGAVTGSVSIDGSANVSLTTTVNHNHDDRYLKLAGGWMDTDAQIGFKGYNSSTSIYAGIAYLASVGGNRYHLGSDTYNTKGLYIYTNGYNASNDWGGLAIDNDGVTAFGAGDTGSVFRVINEDNAAQGAQFAVLKENGAYVRNNLTVGTQSVDTNSKLAVIGNVRITNSASNTGCKMEYNATDECLEFNF